eukprot:2507388-Rhodomonas_salina.2
MMLPGARSGRGVRSASLAAVRGRVPLPGTVHARAMRCTVLTASLLCDAQYSLRACYAIAGTDAVLPTCVLGPEVGYGGPRQYGRSWSIMGPYEARNARYQPTHSLGKTGTDVA